MSRRITNEDSTQAAHDVLPSRLADVLERYLADLETGAAPSCESLLNEHPDLAEELRPYLESLKLLHGAARDMKTITRSAGAEAKEATKPRQVGDYRIVREIGRGGMGIVYEAHQESLNRQVALKILPFAAVLDQRQIARFRNEAQAAAQLHHAHIVPVFAVGQEQGVYYYAMQYIEGQSLEQAIDELRKAEEHRVDRTTKIEGAIHGSTSTMAMDAHRRWSTPRTMHADFFHTVARLGIEAAEALHHAHEHGIIHRDVKPSNLLLDQQGALWVTDFGLARMQAGNGVTLTGDVVGTLRYMSPEQAAGEAVLDARTDVYSLGVTLYELLTRRHAHAGDERQVVLRQIAGDEPIAPRRIDPTIPADLETVILTAMAKSRDERYATARAFAEDLERYLTGKPTLAKRPSLADRAVKWARRHRSLVKLAASAVLVLCVVSIAALALVLREQARTAAALTEAEQSAHAARENFQQAWGALDKFGIRMANRLMEIPGAEAAHRDLLVAELEYYHQFIAEVGDDPRLRHEAALAHFKSGAIASKLGATTDAIAEYHKAKELLSQLAAADPSNEKVAGQIAVTYNNLGLLLASRGDTAEAANSHNAAVVIQQRLLQEQPRNERFIDQLAESHANMGMLLDQVGDSEGAERSLRAAIDLLRSILASQERNANFARNLAIVHNNLSYVVRTRDPAAAAAASREAIALLERLVGESHSEFQDDLALCYNNMAALENQSERWNDAIAWHKRAIALQEQMNRKAPNVVRHQSELAMSLNNLGVVYCKSTRPAEADSAFERSRSLLATLVRDFPDQLSFNSAWAALLNNQAMALAASGRHQEALKLYPVAIDAQRKCWQAMPDAMGEPLSKMYYNYGQSLQHAGRLSAATQAALARREVWRENGPRLFNVALELAEIAQLSLPAGSTVETQKLHEEIIATLDASHEAGWQGQAELANDERFDFLRKNEQFEQLIASWPRHSPTRDSQARVKQSNAPRTKN